MNKKMLKISYWIVTIIFVAFFIFDGIVKIIQIDQAKEIMIHLGYPLYILSILGVASILGSIAIIQTKFYTIKEWAYAGFTIKFLGASASRAFAMDGFMLIISPLVFLAVMFASYILWKKVYKRNS